MNKGKVKLILRKQKHAPVTTSKSDIQKQTRALQRWAWTGRS